VPRVKKKIGNFRALGGEGHHPGKRIIHMGPRFGCAKARRGCPSGCGFNSEQMAEVTRDLRNETKPRPDGGGAFRVGRGNRGHDRRLYYCRRRVVVSR